MKPVEEYVDFIKTPTGVTIKPRPVPVGLTDEEGRKWRRKAETAFETGAGFPWSELHEHLKSLP